MLPLMRDRTSSHLHIPRKSAELYQGLSIALTGGLALPTFLNPTVISALIRLLKDFQPRKSFKEQELHQDESMKLVQDKS